MFMFCYRKELSLNQKNKGAAIEKPLFVVQGCLEMNNIVYKLLIFILTQVVLYPVHV